MQVWLYLLLLGSPHERSQDSQTAGALHWAHGHRARHVCATHPAPSTGSQCWQNQATPHLWRHIETNQFTAFHCLWQRVEDLGTSSPHTSRDLLLSATQSVFFGVSFFLSITQTTRLSPRQPVYHPGNLSITQTTQHCQHR